MTSPQFPNMLSSLACTCTTGNVLAALSIGLAVIYFLWRRRLAADSDLPPNPGTPLPLFGHVLHFQAKDPRRQMRQWRERLGDVFSFRLGPKLTVVLNGYEAIYEAFVKRGDVFSDRPFNYYDWALKMEGCGIVMSSGHTWKEQRTVSLNILRTFGLGKNVLAERILEEVQHLLNKLETLGGESRDIHMLISNSVSNVMCSMLVGRRFEYEDPTFQRLLYLTNYNLSHATGPGPLLLGIWPSLHYLPGDLFRGKIINRNRVEVTELFVEHYKNLKSGAEYDEENLDNFISAYVAERNRKEKAGEVNTLDDRNLSKTIEDLFGAGTETTSSTIAWCLLYMLRHPEVQERVFREIDSEVGSGRLPNLEDRHKLPYLNAVIMETQRLGNIIPLGVPHMCSADVTFRGHRIPAGAIIIANMDSVFMDEKTWGEDADEFRPERFLDDSGCLKQYEEFVPFSLGRRFCLGDAMAKMELFLFLAALFQRFCFLPEEPGNPPPIKEQMSITRTPAPYNVCVVSRS